jgi:hypothetical protein
MEKYYPLPEKAVPFSAPNVVVAHNLLALVCQHWKSLTGSMEILVAELAGKVPPSWSSWSKLAALDRISLFLLCILHKPTHSGDG